ncbi:hypothetical protein V6Z11_D10G118100 [Gossypium hirsutum]
MVYKITVNGCGHTAKHRKWNLPMAMDTQQNNAVKMSQMGSTYGCGYTTRPSQIEYAYGCGYTAK